MINIFISSTFKQFQQERDWIRIYVQPQLNEFAKEHFGESIHVTDLRWGIDTSSLPIKSRLKHVLSACYDSIIKGQIFLGLLGETYGSKVEKDIIEEVIREKSNTLSFPLSKYSITHFEFEVGMQIDTIKRLFCVLETDDRDNETTDMFNYIQQYHKEETHIYTYSERQAFYTCTLVDLLKKCICDLCQENMWQWHLTWYQNQKKSQQQRIKTLYNPSVIANSHLAEINELIETTPLLIIQAKDGAGKSTVMGALRQFIQEENDKSIYIFIGDGTQCNTVNDFYRLLICELLGTEPHDLMGLDLDKLYETLLSAFASEHCDIKYLLVDGIEKLYTDFVNVFQWIPNSTPNKLHIVMTINDEIELPLRLPFYPTSILYRLPELNRGEQLDMINQLLFIEGKTLHPSLISTILAKKEAVLPLYLETIVFRLTLFNERDYTAILESEKSFPEAQLAYLFSVLNDMPMDFGPMSYYILQIACNMFENNNYLWETLFLIGNTQNGLRRTDINEIFSDILEWRQWELSVFFQYMKPFFLEDDFGRITFAYPRIQEMFINCSSFQPKLYSYIAMLPQTDPVKQSEYPALCLKYGYGLELAIYLDQFNTESEWSFIESLGKMLNDEMLLNNAISIVESVKYKEDFCNWLCVLASAAKGVFCNTVKKTKLIETFLGNLVKKADEPSGNMGFTPYEGMCYCECMKALAKFYINQRRYNEAVDCFDNMCDIYTSLWGNSINDVRAYFQIALMGSIKSLSQALFMSKQTKKCEEINNLLINMIMSIEETSDLYSNKAVFLFEALQMQGVQLCTSDKLNEGIQSLELAQKLAEYLHKIKCDDTTFDRLISVNVNLAGAYHNNGKHVKSLEISEKTEQLLGDKKISRQIMSDLIILRDNMALSYMELKQYEHAKVIFEKTIEYWNRMSIVSDNISNYWKLAKAYLNLSYALKMLEKHKESEDAFCESHNIFLDVAIKNPSEQNVDMYIQMLETSINRDLSLIEAKTCVTAGLNLIITLYNSNSIGQHQIDTILHLCLLAVYKKYIEDNLSGIQLLKNLENSMELFWKGRANADILLQYTTLLETISEGQCESVREKYMHTAIESYYEAYVKSSITKEQNELAISAVAFWIIAIAKEVTDTPNRGLSIEQIEWIKLKSEKISELLYLYRENLLGSKYNQLVINGVDLLEQCNRENGYTDISRSLLDHLSFLRDSQSNCCNNSKSF